MCMYVFTQKHVCICVRVHVCVYNALPQYKMGMFCYQVFVSQPTFADYP